jgi:hypothetical protein
MRYHINLLRRSASTARPGPTLRLRMAFSGTAVAFGAAYRVHAAPAVAVRLTLSMHAC